MEIYPFSSEMKIILMTKVHSDEKLVDDFSLNSL